MSIWSENYHFIKEVYDFRLEEMNKWMDALEESSKKLITNKVYTSREFRRMRDQFRYQCKNLKREELKQWLHDMLKLLNQKSDQNLEAEKKRLESMIQRHAEMLPGVQENIRKVDVYSKCYQYVDDITPLVKLLEELRRKSSEDAYEGKKSQGAANTTKIHPDSTEQVASFIESQEANIAKIEEKRSEFTQLIKRGDKLGTQPDCPDFLKERVKSLSELFQETEVKAKHKLSVLKVNEKAWQEYDDGSLLMTNLLDQADEKLRNIRKMYEPKAGAEDLAVRRETAKKTRESNETCMTRMKESVAIIYKICSPDKKIEVERAMNVFEERSKVLEKTDSRIKYLTEYTEGLQKYCDTIDETLSWLDVGQKELEELMKFPGEDKSDEKLLMTVKMQKHMENKLAVLQHLVSEQERLLAGKSNMTVEGYMRDVDHIRVKLDELNTKLKEVSGEISEDLHHWADYQAELKVFRPWLDEVEQRIKAGLKKPASLSEAEELFTSIKTFNTDIRDRDNCLTKMRGTVSKMTQHGRADKEIEECSKRRLDGETVSTEWLERVEKLVKQWEELNCTVTEVQDWVAATEKKKDIPDKEEVDTTLNKLKSFFVAKEELVAAL